MASIASPLASGTQQLYDKGFFPSALSQDTLSKASPSQLNQLAAASIASQQTSALFGTTTSDNVSLSSDATNALLQEINPASAADSSSSATDYLTQAVNNALTNNLNSAVNQFSAPAPTSSGKNVNVVG
jgi:hypothetical protein